MGDLLDPFAPDDDTGGRTPAFLVFVIGAVVGALLVGAVWVVVSRTSDPSGSRQAASQAVGNSRAGAVASPTPAGGCAGVFQAQEAVLSAAADSLSQWQVHTDEMNELVTGAGTLDQTLASWDRARGGAQRLVNEFQTALEEYRKRDARCPEAGIGSSVAPTAGTCAAAVADRSVVIRSAVPAIRTWGRHIDEMEMLRLGDKTQAELTQMWLKTWRTAVRQLSTYNTGVARVRSESC